MSITDELRDWVSNHYSGWPSKQAEGFSIADRIDAEALSRRNEAYNMGYKAGINMGFASADDWLADHEDAMAERGWVKLPVSEDGDVLHIGELVDEKLPFGGYAAPAPIDTMELSRGASGYGWMVKLDAENRALISPKLLRHHHEPTVEDVLRELLREYDRDDSELTDGEIIERFAAKLRLAGDAE